MSAADVTVYPSADALAQQVAEWIVERAAGTRDRFALNLSGGSTPKRLYQRLAAAPLRERMPWPRVHLFFGDERFVPYDDKESNYRMVREAMIAEVPIPAENVHPVPVDGAPEDAARRYEAELKLFYGADRLDPRRPLFDVTLLGLGEDGHTASLFPGIALLEERVAWVGAVVGAKPEPRISLTYPALDSSAAVAFLVAGEGKRAILEKLLAGDLALPSARINPLGEKHVFADPAAAGTAATPGVTHT